jgi:ABC-type antimicrobial peptide transport system permease subunit
VAYAVGQRTREIGLRMALGATSADVLRLVIGGGMRLALAGMAIGFAAVLLLTRLIANLLFGLSPTDPVTLAGIVVLLGAATLFACWLPAQRAARVDPMVALRHD